MREPFVVECRDVAKAYAKGRQVVFDCNFRVAPGRCAAIIGANGAGKTTLLNLLLGTVKADQGQIDWFGKPLADGLPLIYKQVAFVPEDHVFYPNWTGQRVLCFVRSFYECWNHDQELLLIEELKIPLSQRTRTFSKGNRTKLSLLLALSQTASVFVMDEPFSGLDPLIREELLALISQQIRRHPHTLVVTSHDLFAVEFLADDLWVIHDGKFLYQGPIADFLASYRSFWLDDAAVAEELQRTGAFVRERCGNGSDSRFAVVAATPVLDGLGSNWEARALTLQDAYSACVSAHDSRSKI